MRLAYWSTVLGLGWILLAGCDGGQREDVLVVYSAGPRPVAEDIVAAFSRETEADVELFAATTGQVMARLEAERYRPRADVVIFASRVAAEALKHDQRLLRYAEPPWLSETETDWHDPDHYYFATSAALVGMAFRDSVYDEEADWNQFLSPDPGMRLTMPSPSRSGAAGDLVVSLVLDRGDAIWPELLDARGAGLDFAAANSQAISTTLVGAFDGILGAVDYLIFGQIADGAPLIVHYPPSGSALVERPIGILASTPNAELSRRFVDYYLSTEAQERVAAAHLLPARTDVGVSDIRGSRDLPPLLERDIETALKQQSRILRRFQLEVERAEIAR